MFAFRTDCLLQKSHMKITNNESYLIMGTSNDIPTSYYTVWQPSKRQC